MLPRALGPELERLSSAMSAAYTARPITQGAAVVLPRRPSVTRLSQLPPDEAADLFATAASVSAAHADGAQGFNWSMKDSWSLGAPEPEQLHLHVVPRFAPTEEGMFCRDFRENDAVYEQLEAWHPEPGARTTPPVREWPDDASRANRTEETMAAEAMAYREVQEGGGCVASSTDCCDGLAVVPVRASARANHCTRCSGDPGGIAWQMPFAPLSLAAQRGAGPVCLTHARLSARHRMQSRQCGGQSAGDAAVCAFQPAAVATLLVYLPYRTVPYTHALLSLLSTVLLLPSLCY